MLVKLRGLLLVLPLLTPMALPAISAAETPANLSETYGKVPLQFEENRAQADEAVRFLAHGPGYSLYLTSKDAVLVLAKTGKKAGDEPSEAVSVRMSVVGARSTAAVAGVDELPGKANYFIGNDPSRWRTNVPTYAKVRYSGVYPGIDLVYYGQQRQLEYDFVVAPEANPDDIVLGFEGADSVEIDAHGELVLRTAAGDVRQHKPVVYQEASGVRHQIEGSYVRKGTTRVGFKVAEYDRSRPLVIDPVLVYSTYLGGHANDAARAIATDVDGNVYVTGFTYGSTFPSTPGAFQAQDPISNNVFVVKLDSTGSAVEYSAFLSGAQSNGVSGTSDPRGIAIDSDRNVYLTGVTSSPTFPTTPGAFQRVSATGLGAFVTKLNAAGSGLVYSTYLGGSRSDAVPAAIAVDADHNAYVAGSTGSADFPTTTDAFQASFRGFEAAFVTKLDASGGALVYSTFLSGGTGSGLVFTEGSGIAVDSVGEAYVVGHTNAFDFPTTAGAYQRAFRGEDDAFVTKLSSTGAALVYSTYLGGSRTTGPSAPSGSRTNASGIAIDASGNAYVTGKTTSSDFPVTPGAFQARNALSPKPDAFVTKLDSSGSALVYSTYLGGADDDSASAIAVDIDGNAFITGSTVSPDFPITRGTCQRGYGGGGDAFAAMFDINGALVYATYLGFSGADVGVAIAVDTGGNAYVAGNTGPTGFGCGFACTRGSDDFPTTPHAFQADYGGGDGDAFVVKIAEPELPVAAPPAPIPATANSAQMPAATTNVADGGSAISGSGGGGAFDWLTLSALLAAAGFARRRRAG